jgi:hypothetical protein
LPIAVLCGAATTIYLNKQSPAGSVYFVCLAAGASASHVAIDSAGNAYVAFNNAVMKVNAAGTALVYSVTLGTVTLNDIAVDASGNAYVVGTAPSATVNDVFVAKLNAAGTAFVYAVTFGGSGDDQGGALAIDASGNAYVTGTTFSANFPLALPLQVSLRGGQDAFVAKLNAAGTLLQYSTYLGGNQPDYGQGIAVDNAGNAYVGGLTSSIDNVESFPVTSGAAQTVPGGAGDAYVAKLTATGALAYATYVGGNSGDIGTAIAVDRVSGAAYLTGWTQSTNLPLSTPLQATFQGLFDSFVTEVSPAGNVFLFSSYLGGSSSDIAADIAVDSQRNAYVAGGTFSPTFPTGSVANHGNWDSYILKINGP